MKPRVTLIAALSEDGFISRGQGVPWDLPDDKAHFRHETAGHWLLLGRRTYEEMIGWFCDHKPLVLSKDTGFQPAHGERVTDVEAALARVGAAGADELVVVGGSGTLAAAMPFTDRLDLTLVHTYLGDGVPFPTFDPSGWRKVTETPHPADDRHAFAFTFTTWERVPDNGSEV